MLFESSYCFSIPFQILHHIIPKRSELLNQFPENSSLFRKYKKHYEDLKKSFIIYEKQFMKIEKYQGLSFRPSPYKNDKNLSCIPINLHTHVTILQDSKENANSYHFLHTTLGAPAAHNYR